MGIRATPSSIETAGAFLLSYLRQSHTAGVAEAGLCAAQTSGACGQTLLVHSLHIRLPAGVSSRQSGGMDTDTDHLDCYVYRSGGGDAGCAMELGKLLFDERVRLHEEKGPLAPPWQIADEWYWMRLERGEIQSPGFFRIAIYAIWLGADLNELAMRALCPERSRGIRAQVRLDEDREKCRNSTVDYTWMDDPANFDDLEGCKECGECGDVDECRGCWKCAECCTCNAIDGDSGATIAAQGGGAENSEPLDMAWLPVKPYEATEY